MNFFEIHQHRHGSLHQSGEVPRRQRMDGDAAREDRGRPARDHLEPGDHEQQAGYDRNTGGDRDHREEEHDDAEGTLVQAAHQPAEGEVIRRCFVVQPLQHVGGRDKRTRVGAWCGLQFEPPDLLTQAS